MSAKDERRGRSRRPAVVCKRCGFAWHSAAMAYGLRLLGSCPRCDGTLDFEPAPPPPEPKDVDVPAEAPHLAMGLPRPPRRD
jgi:hypothetical protein